MRPVYLVLAAIVAALSPSPVCAAPGKVAKAPPAELSQRFTLVDEADTFPTPIDTSNGLVLLKITVNGHDAWAMLDNASDRTIVDMAFAKSLGLAIGPVVEAIDLGPAKLEERLIQNIRIVIPGQMILSGDVLAVDLQSFSQMVGRPIQAIVGGDYLNHMSVLIQNSRKQMILALPGKITPRVKVATLPLINGRQVAATVNDKPVILDVDTGFNGTVRLTDAAWARVVPAAAAVRKSATVSIDGVARTHRSVKDATFKLGPVTADGMSISVGEKLPRTSDGLLGMTFLSKTDFILDVEQKKLILIPIP